MSQTEALQVRIFVCQNALKGNLENKPLQELGLPEGSDVERVPCLGKIDPRYLLRIFESGCDAVCLIGCPVGKCSTMDGNLRARKRVAFVGRILDEIGLGGERLLAFLQEPMDEEGFQEAIGKFLETVRALGPSELRTRTNARSD